MIVNSLEEKLGEDILLLDLVGQIDFADYFVICTGPSERTLEPLAEAAVRDARTQLKARGRIEGNSQDGWVLVDFGDVIVHIFTEKKRAFYRLEDLWKDGKIFYACNRPVKTHLITADERG